VYHLNLKHYQIEEAEVFECDFMIIDHELCKVDGRWCRPSESKNDEIIEQLRNEITELKLHNEQLEIVADLDLIPDSPEPELILETPNQSRQFIPQEVVISPRSRPYENEDITSIEITNISGQKEIRG